MVQRRLPSGQGPARGGARPTAAAGARPAGRGALRRSVERSPRPDAPTRSPGPDAAADRPSRRYERTADGGERVGRTGVRRAAGPARRTKAPRGPRRVSGRAAALGVLLIALTLAYAYPLRVYLAQQSQIDQMQTAQQEQRQRIQDLTDQLARWNDDEFVTAQARSRLQLVRAGERLYVIGVESAPAGAPAGGAPAPWYQQLWSSVQTADDPPS